MNIFKSLKLLFSDLYTFNRYISQPKLCYKGTATFENVISWKIEYNEQALYQLLGKAQMCYQNRIFVLDPPRFSINKNDGSLLHKFNLENISAKFPLKLEHTHICGNDQYLLFLRVYSENQFCMDYRINGPSKNYGIYTEYQRLKQIES